MEFTILGAGALGSILAAHLAEAGHGVNVIARGKRLEFLEKNGVVLRGLNDLDTNCHIISDPGSISRTDVLILTPKTYQHKAALEQVRHIETTSVFSVTNGVQKTEQLVSEFGKSTTLGCMADLSGELVESGEVLFTRNIDVQIGGLDSSYQDQAERIAECIHSAGINCHAVSNIVSVEWSKFVPWLALISVAVLSRLPSWQFLLDPGSAKIIYRITCEMYELACKLDIELIDQSPAPASSIANASEDSAVRIITEIGEEMKAKAPLHKMSALQDLENGRPLELEETIGYALEKAHEHNVSMPTVDNCYQLICAINRANIVSP